MKQRITIEQLNELADDQKEQLREWWTPETYDVALLPSGSEFAVEVYDGLIGTVSDSEGIVPPIAKHMILPLLSIGQMIEFMFDRGHKITIDNCKPASVKNCLIDKEYCQMELCDALWKAVKEVL